jgi:hypothetical protein
VYNWLVIFCFVLAVKREYNPSGLEGEGVVEYFVKVCFLKSKNHLERLSFLSQGFITFLYCEFSLHHTCAFLCEIFIVSCLDSKKIQ